MFKTAIAGRGGCLDQWHGTSPPGSSEAPGGGDQPAGLCSSLAIALWEELSMGTLARPLSSQQSVSVQVGRPLSGQLSPRGRPRGQESWPGLSV